MEGKNKMLQQQQNSNKINPYYKLDKVFIIYEYVEHAA